MTADDGETPSADELDDQFNDQFADEPTPRGDGRYTWLPVAGAAVLAGALVLVAIVLNLGNGNDDPSYGKQVDTGNNLLCPKTFHQQTTQSAPVWTPVKPNQVKAKHALVPKKSPTNVVVCAYLPPAGTTLPADRLSRATVPLTGRHIVKKGLNTINQTLIRIKPGRPGACPQYLTTTDGDDYLIGLTYESGTLWVSAPGNHCSGASNGSFMTSANLRAFAAATYAQGV